MGVLHLGVRRFTIGDVLVVQDLRGFARNLVDFARKAADPRVPGELVETTLPDLLRSGT